MSTLNPKFLELLCCPVTRQPLHQDGNSLVSADGSHRFSVDELGVPYFAEQFCSPQARIQEQHYDKVAEKYVENLGYPHTIEYTRYLDEALFAALPSDGLGVTAELCCGRGEAVRLLQSRIQMAVGIDISTAMLQSARRDLSDDHVFFAQGDATMLPLADAVFDSVVMLGGIHHVPDRQKLFFEINRVLKPGGCFYWREPVSDLFLWRWLRAIVYRVSPALDHDTERPLRWNETVPLLESAGLRLVTWKTYGFLGFCVFMNSDVLVFNRLFRFVPGIRGLVGLSTRLDDWIVRLPFLRKGGLQVVGVAAKPLERNG